jgi:hypothetical protein
VLEFSGCQALKAAWTLGAFTSPPVGRHRKG